MEGQTTVHTERTGGWFLNHGNNLRCIWYFSAGEQIFNYNSLHFFGWEQMHFKKLSLSESTKDKI